MTDHYHSCRDGVIAPGRTAGCPRCSRRRSPSSARSRRPAARWAARVLRRDRVCRCCEQAPSTVAHHIVAVADAPDFAEELSNGLGLCARCHALAKNRGATLRELKAHARIAGITAP